MRGEGGVAGEEKLVGAQKFYCWGNYTMLPLTNINSDWMSNTSSGWCITLHYMTLFGLFRSLFATRVGTRQVQLSHFCDKVAD